MAQLITLTLTEKNEKQPAQQRDATNQQQQLQGHNNVNYKAKYKNHMKTC